MRRNILISVMIIVTLALTFLMIQDRMLLENEDTVESDPAKIEEKPNKMGTEEMEENMIEQESQGNSKEEMIESKFTCNEFQAGMNLLIYGHPDIPDAQRMFKRLRRLGVNSVAITFPFYQVDWQASEVGVNRENTPTMAELNRLVEEAHAAGLCVMLRPILDEESFMSSGLWRGQIQPKDPKAWFNSYRSLLVEYANLAQTNHVAWFNIGTELNSLQNRYSDEWAKLIKELRAVYQGDLIYSFNWDTVHDISTNEFVKLLDHVGLDAYFPLNAPDDASVATLKAEWEKLISDIEKDLNGQSVVITEAGMIPVAGAHRQPYVWSIPDGIVDWQAQANYYEATYKVWRPRIQGMYWWTVTLDQEPGVIDYSPLASPTESVIKQHFLKEETTR